MRAVIDWPHWSDVAVGYLLGVGALNLVAGDAWDGITMIAASAVLGIHALRLRVTREALERSTKSARRILDCLYLERPDLKGDDQ